MDGEKVLQQCTYLGLSYHRGEGHRDRTGSPAPARILGRIPPWQASPRRR